MKYWAHNTIIIGHNTFAIGTSAMCGIVGFCNGSGDHLLQIQRMTDRIIRRGPDSRGYWMTDDKTVVLGHRRLSVLDCTDNGSQPMLSRSGRYVISYNGEIYNHLEIRKMLNKRNSFFRGTSDTETLIEAFDAYGIDDTLGMIKGMFAIALYDTVSRTLYLARDRVGEKPLYYGFVSDRFVFASDIACFYELDDSNMEIDKASVELFFRRGYIPAPYSIFKGIRKLEPGHYLKIDYPYSSIIDIEYWSSLDISIKCHSNTFSGSIYEAEEELERLLKCSLKGQMLSDVPLGVFLSAGVDSSTVVSLMQEISDHPIKTFTIGVESPEYNEAPIAREVSKILGTEHTEEYISLSEMKAIIPSISQIYSEPFADSSQIPTSMISYIARKKVTVVLSGDGGDELFCGYGRYNGWINAEWDKQRRFPIGIQRMRGNLLKLLGSSDEGKIRRLLSGNLAQIYAALERHDTGFVRTDRLFWDYYDRFDESKVAGLFSSQDILMQMDFGEYLSDDILVKVDRAAMYHSLETRIPFLDKDVIEFVWSLPLEMKYKDGVTKKLLRNILYKHVPRELMERPKTGFSIPIYQWLRDGETREWAERLFDEMSYNGASEYIDERICREMWNSFLYENKSDERIWFLIVFLQWYQEYKSITSFSKR